MEVGVHARFEYGNAAQLVELGAVRIVVEGARDQDVEIGIAGLTGGKHQVHALHGAEFGADEDGGSLFRFALHIATFGADALAGPGDQRCEHDFVFFVRLLHARGFQIFKNHADEVGGIFAFGGEVRFQQLVVFIYGERAMRRQALYRERPGYAHLALIFVGLVIEVFVLGFGGDGGVDFLLARDACLPPFRVQAFGFGGPGVFGFARDLPFFPRLFQCRVERPAQGFERELILVPDDVDFGVVGDGFQRDVRNAFVVEALA